MVVDGDDDGRDTGDQTDGSDGADGYGDAGDDGAGTCDVPEYGDGTCQTEIDCEAPDIDCFVFFDGQPAADAFFAGFEEQLAAEEFRPPRPVVPDTDPRFQRMRELLDRGWAAYQEANSVADLAEHSPALVVIQDPTANAFVIPDLATGRAGFAVIVQTGLLDQNPPDEAMLGLVMHELQHAVGLHIVGDVKERLRRYYVADGDEPLGFQQEDDAAAREAGTGWRELAEEIGPFTQEELGGLPFGTSQLGQVFTTVVKAGLEQDSDSCAAPVAEHDALTQELGATYSALDADLHLGGGPVREQVDAVLAGLRDLCLPGFTAGFVDVVAEIAGVTPDEIRAQLSAEDLALVEGVHVIDAVAALAIDRRARMRGIEESFAAEAGQPWSALRFYSFEEAADDATVPVLDTMGLPADGLSGFLFGVQDPATQTGCSEILDAGDTPPYGADLSDEHHATCWRVDHVRAVAASGALTRTAPRTGAPLSLRRRLPIPPRLSDLVVY